MKQFLVLTVFFVLFYHFVDPSWWVGILIAVGVGVVLGVANGLWTALREQ